MDPLMIRLINPLNSKSDFNELTDSLMRFLNDPDSFKFLSYSLIKFDKESVESLTHQHRAKGIEYIVSEDQGKFSGIVAVKRNQSPEFELYLLVVDKDYQRKGIGQSLINECLALASKENYRIVDTSVFADNKNMLRLLIKNNFIPIDIQYKARADGMDLLKLRKYL
jgi:ribosomal protein S18 acetylase RimI-like enzyme